MLNQKIRIALVDDEPTATGLIGNYLKRFFEEDIEVVFTCNSPIEALSYLRHQAEIDLLLVDINMPEVSGLELVELIAERKFEVVFITAHADHALKAFQVQALDYILKPIDKSAFVKSMTKVIERVRGLNGLPDLEATKTSSGKLPIIKNGMTLLLDLGKIMYLKAEGSYTRIVTADESHVLSKNLKTVLELLSNDKLIRVNRSYALNADHIKGFSLSKDGMVVLNNGKEVSISRDLKKKVIAQLKALPGQ
ncbi:response regulator transcription factor [bacterium SCSIO 12741]|nr:response regulator transcription factor [bacterium SCSIO 12741]